MAQPQYVPGSTGTQLNRSFMSAYDAIKKDVDPQLTLRYGRERLTGLLDIFGAKKAAIDIKYSHFERDRIQPKIKATTLGAAANSVTFTMDASSQVSYDPATSTAYGGTVGTNAVDSIPVRAGDLIMVKPSSGSVSYGNYIHGIVESVNTAAGTFVASSLDGSNFPVIATADEIIIYGNAHGEGSTQPGSRHYKATEYTNYLQDMKDTLELTSRAKEIQKWFKDEKGQAKYMLAGEDETLTTFLNQRELTLLWNPGLANTAISNTFNNAGTPLSMNKGLVQEILDRGNEYNYSGISGFTMADFDELVVILDKQKGAKENLMLNGIQLNGQLDRELGDRFKNGGVSFGQFQMDEKKHVDLGFSSISVNGYTFHKKVCDAMNDLQTLGADGFGFPYEGMVLPIDMTKNADEGSVPSLRLRYLENNEFRAEHIDGFAQFESGRDVHQVRYKSTIGIEAFALNRAVYVKRA